MALRYSFVLGLLLASQADAIDPGTAQALSPEQLLDAEVAEAANALREASAALTKELSEMPKGGISASKVGTSVSKAGQSLDKLGNVAGTSVSKLGQSLDKLGNVAGTSVSKFGQSSDKLGNVAETSVSKVLKTPTSSQISDDASAADLKIDRTNAAKAVAKKKLRQTNAETALEKANAKKDVAKTEGLAKAQKIVKPRSVKTQTESEKVNTETAVKASTARVLKVETNGKEVSPAKATKAEPAENSITKAEPAEAVEHSTKPKQEEEKYEEKKQEEAKQKPSVMDNLFKDLQRGPKYESQKAQKTTDEVADAQREMKATSKDEKGVVGIVKKAVSNAWDAVAGTTKEHHEHHAETKKERDASHVKIREDLAKHHARIKEERDAEHLKIKKDTEKQLKDAAEKHVPATDDHN